MPIKALRIAMLATPHGRIMLLTRRVVKKIGSKLKKGSAKEPEVAADEAVVREFEIIKETGDQQRV